jgi:hypothetical protein
MLLMNAASSCFAPLPAISVIDRLATVPPPVMTPLFVR